MRDVPGFHQILKDRIYSKSVTNFYERWQTVKEIHTAAKRFPDKVPMTHEIASAYKENKFYSDILSDIWKHAKTTHDPQDQFRIATRYANGMAREAMGLPELDTMPTIWDGNMNPAMDQIREDVGRRLIVKATATAPKRRDRESRESLMERQEKFETEKDFALKFLPKLGSASTLIREYTRVPKSGMNRRAKRDLLTRRMNRGY